MNIKVLKQFYRCVSVQFIIKKLFPIKVSRYTRKKFVEMEFGIIIIMNINKYI